MCVCVHVGVGEGDGRRCLPLLPCNEVSLIEHTYFVKKDSIISLANDGTKNIYLIKNMYLNFLSCSLIL